MVILQTFFHQSTKINTDQRSWRQHLTTIRNELSRKCRIESTPFGPKRTQTEQNPKMCSARGIQSIRTFFGGKRRECARTRCAFVFYRKQVVFIKIVKKDSSNAV